MIGKYVTLMEKTLQEEKSRNFYVLVGPPAVGKSTWMSKNVKKPYVISRDNLVDEVASENGLTYDDLFSPEYEHLSKEVNRRLAYRVKSAYRSNQDIVVDMTNMNKRSRQNAFTCIYGNEDEFHKVAVIFEFKGKLDKIKQTSAERFKQTGKKIPDSVIDSMAERYEEPELSEGFDQIIKVKHFSDK
jgi:tRNA uridine 5-carbamoylmethylation protein Kti12